MLDTEPHRPNYDQQNMQMDWNLNTKSQKLGAYREQPQLVKQTHTMAKK